MPCNIRKTGSDLARKTALAERGSAGKHGLSPDPAKNVAGVIKEAGWSIPFPRPALLRSRAES